MRHRIVGVGLAALVIGSGAVFAAQGAGADGASRAGEHETAAQSATEHTPELEAQLDMLRRATARFRDHQVAVDEGYVLVAGDGPLMGEHWVRRDLVDRPFDIESPSTLQYLEIDGEYVLTGVAYTVYRAPDEPLPDGFFGDLDAWHVHDMIKISMTTTEERPLLRWLTERRIANGRTQWSEDRAELTMVHAWVWVENPDGVFAQDHRLIPYLRVGLPHQWGMDASLEAARGAALLSEEACRSEVRRTSWLAGTDWRQRRQLRSSCAAATAAVRVALDDLEGRFPSTDPTFFNASAERAWHGYLEARAAVLTTEQAARLSVGIEHPEGHGGH